MRFSKSGLTLIELILTLAIAAIVIPLGYSLLFVGNGMFNVSAGTGLSQQNVRLLSDFIKNELQNVSFVSDNTDAFHTKYYSLEYDTSLNQVIKKYYEFNDSTSSYDVTLVESINGHWDILSISNSTPGKLDVNIGHEEIIGNKESRFDLSYKVDLRNAQSLENGISVDFTQTISGQPVKLYYLHPKNYLDDVSIGIKDLESGESGETIGTSTITFDANGGSGEIAPITSMINSDVVLPNGLTLSNSENEFKGWSTTTDGSGAIYLANSIIKMPSTNITLYALWADESIKLESVTLGNVLLVGDKSPVKHGTHGYKIDTGVTTVIKISLDGFTANHIGKVQISSTSDTKVFVELIHQIQQDLNGYFINITIKPPKDKNTNFSITLTPTTDSKIGAAKTFNFRTSD